MDWFDCCHQGHRVIKREVKVKLKTMVDEEIKINCKIRHPNIVQLMAVAYDCHGINLVTEFINGFNMEDLIFDEETKRNTSLNLSNKLFISMQCLQAVSYLHDLEKAIIHRDIKPANILIDGQSYITKLCDLGVSRVKSYTFYSLTNLGQPGTPGYMAPEILLEGKSATVKGDIWAIGISLIEFFAEEEAWGELNSYEEIKIMLQKGEPPRALALTKIPEPMNNILRDCVRFNPDVRPNALEVHKEICVNLQK
ncbi:unnamed protein product [Mytilus coruscus]|uniref:Protein kinase domain-containing protein n=1 Tax=Mytilus coruscus TaxID=42192 RepID=A0A6J8CWJ0_MYTCO|nr:unnamed protein product [Mytilus coruscus]